MRLFNLVLLVFLFNIQIYLAQNRDNAEFTVWIKNNPDQKEICIYYKSIGVHWDNSGNITSSYSGGVSDCPIHPTDVRRDFYYITSYTDPLFGRGLYFFEVQDESNYPLQQLYIDWRTTEIPPPNGGSPDIDFDYDVKNNSFKFDDKFILNMSYFGAWDLKDNMNCTTTGLSQFWQNCLVMVNKNNHPYLIWGAHPTITANSYKLYRSVTNNYNGKYVLIATTNSNTFDYVDNNTSYTSANPVYYYVKAYMGHTQEGLT